jgi:enoyl-CoA hydratase/carnithine racemase
MGKHIVTVQSGRTLSVSFNRPEQMNAVSHDMYSALADALDSAAASDEIRSVLISGNGKAFTAGNDLSDFAKPMPEHPPVTRFLETIRDFRKPIVAAVNGVAVGVGVTMLLHCDIVIAADVASFRAPFAHLGLVPEAGASLLLPQAIGMALANDMLIAGRTLSAEEALQAGLVSRVFPKEQLLDNAFSVASEIANQAPNATCYTKALVRFGRDVIDDQMKREAECFSDQLKSAEFREVVSAMFQKRTPQFA